MWYRQEIAPAFPGLQLFFSKKLKFIRPPEKSGTARHRHTGQNATIPMTIVMRIVAAGARLATALSLPKTGPTNH